MKKVLLVTDVNFWEKSSGHRMRIAALIGYLSKQVALTVVNTGPAPLNIEAALAEEIPAGFFVLEKSKYLSSNGYGRKLKSFLKGRQFDVVIIEYIHSSYFLNFITGDAKIILDAHDIISDRADEFKKFNLGGALYEMSQEDEFEIFEVYDHVMVICQPDFEKLSAALGQSKPLLCPHPSVPVKRPVNTEVKNIAFVASEYLPNRDAIEWFITACWPQITARHNVHLNIYGTVCYVIGHSNLPSVSYLGFVADLEQVYAQTDIIINPVRFGAGLKIKNIEALASGIPLVTTSHGARGLEPGAGSAFLVADGADDFVDALLSVINDEMLRLKLTERAYTFIAENFSADSCYGPLLKAICF